MLHVTSSPADWYATRAAGIVAYLLLTGVLLVGMTTARRVRLRQWPRFALVDVHRFGGLLTGVFVTLHVVTIAIDAFLPFSIIQILVPFASAYRPLWTGLGVVAMELLVALAISNRLRDRLGATLWKRLHMLNFVVWIGATLHGIGSGTDAHSRWAIALYAVAVGAVGAATLARIRSRAARASPVFLAATAASVAVLVAVAVPQLSRPPRRETSAVPRPVFESRLTGKILVQRGPARAIVSMSGRGAGDQAALIRADLLLSQFGTEETSLQLEYLPGGQTCVGRVTGVTSTGFDGRCTMPDGTLRAVRAEWAQTGDSAVRGSLRVTTPEAADGGVGTPSDG